MNILDCSVTCPHCGRETKTEMSPAGGQVEWTCPACSVALRPKKGDCCVFCSWGSVICPPMQDRRDQCCDYPA